MAEDASYILLNRQTVGVSQIGEAYDMGQHNALCVMINRHTATTAGTITIQHSATLTQDSATWKDLLSFDLDATGALYTRVADFLRYVRFTSSGDVGTSPAPVVSLALIGKAT